MCVAASMSAEKYLADAESGVLPITCHEDLLRVAFIRTCEALNGSGWMFEAVEKLHAHGFSFGKDDLRFNRYVAPVAGMESLQYTLLISIAPDVYSSLDTFYIIQITTALYRHDPSLEEEFLPFSEFDAFYQTHYDLMHSSVWRSYYSVPFLSQRTTARFYRLPDLLDLPDSTEPFIFVPRERQIGPTQILKLPRWAYTVSVTRQRNKLLPEATITSLALTTLAETMTRLHEAYPSAQQYSESYARFWLDSMIGRAIWRPYAFGVLVAMGHWNIHGLEAQYHAQMAGQEITGPPRDLFCGFPDGGLAAEAAERGWQEEIGGEEEVQFLAAVAAEETAGLLEEGTEIGKFDLSVRSHILLAVMHAAVKDESEKAQFLEELEKRMVQAGTAKPETVGRWIQEALNVMEPYAHDWQDARHSSAGSDSVRDRKMIFRQILVENPQLFARWRWSSYAKGFNFQLEARV